MSDRRAELEAKKAKLEQLRKMKEQRRQEKESRDRSTAQDIGSSGLSSIRSTASSSSIRTTSSASLLGDSISGYANSASNSDLDDVLKDVGLFPAREFSFSLTLSYSFDFN